MGQAARVRPLYSVEEYLSYEEASPEKHEFVDGEILAMAGGSATHHRIAARIVTALNNSLDSRPCEAIGSDQLVKSETENAFVYPDVTVFCEDARFESRRSDILLTPLVVFEVLSPSTGQYDRSTKLAIYKSIPSLFDYLIVWQDMVRIEQHSRVAGREWTVRSFYHRAEIIELKELDVRLPVELIYQRLDIPEGVLRLDAPEG